MLRVARLTLRKFRSHTAFDQEFDGRSVAISGPNGAGKTNILEALSLLTPGRGLRGANAEEMAQAPEPIGFSISARLVDAEGGAERTVSVSTDLREGARRIVMIDGARESQSALGKLLSAVWLTPAMDRLWIEGAAERRRFLDRAAFALDPEHGAQVAAYEKAMRERNRLLKDLQTVRPSPAEAAWLDAIEARMGESGAAIARTRVATLRMLTEAQEAAIGEGGADGTAFPAADLALAGPLEESGAEEPAALQARLAADRRQDAAAGRTLFGPHRSDLEATYRAKSIAARLCSTGEQKALLVSLVLATARAARDHLGRTPLLLLDEVAAHFDPDRRAALAEEILKLGAQAFLTGAEASLFDVFGDRVQRIALSGPIPSL